MHGYLSTYTARIPVVRTCENCGREYVRSPSRAARQRRHTCSAACLRALKRAALMVFCERCGTEFMARGQSLKAGYGRFCSRACFQESRGTTQERFWAKVNKDGPVPAHMPHLGPCWLWMGSRDQNGYGEWRIGEVLYRSTQLAWEWEVGPLPEGKPFMCHHCDNPPCVRPDHLFPGTALDNARDMVQKGRLWSPYRRGEASVRAKLSDAIVREIRARWVPRQVGLAARLAAEYGVSIDLIRDVVERKVWGHVK